MNEQTRLGSLAGRSPLRSFALGGLLGAAGTIATVRRMKRPGGAPGLAAFEGAPCFDSGESDPEIPRSPDAETGSTSVEQ